MLITAQAYYERIQIVQIQCQHTQMTANSWKRQKHSQELKKTRVSSQLLNNSSLIVIQNMFRQHKRITSLITANILIDK